MTLNPAVDAERVAEFFGPEEFLLAANVAMHCLDFDLVVVRGLGIAAELWKSFRAHGSGELTGLIPNRDEINELAVNYWHAERGIAYPGLTRLTFSSERTSTIGPHIDTNTYGVIGVSINVDPLKRTRHFYAKTNDVATWSPDGFDKLAYDALSSSVQDLCIGALDDTWSGVEQGYDDAVIFRNHPFPTFHAVNTGRDRITAYLFDFHFKY